MDHDGKPFSYRGTSWAQEVTDAQITSVKKLMVNLKQKYPSLPSYKWNGKTTFDILFPPQSLSWSANPGIYTHCSVNAQKVDVLPTPKIIQFFKELVL